METLDCNSDAMAGFSAAPCYASGLTHLDLFSGIGGFAIAAQAAGFNTIAFCEKEPYAQQILIEKFGAILADAKHNGSSPSEKRKHDGQSENGWRRARLSARSRPALHADIARMSGREYAGVDLITGGFPCQPYSTAGQRRGARDDRALWPEMFRIIDEARPAWVLGENVPGIISMELDRVLSDLENIGYACWPLAIPACAVDARHRRERIWIVAYSEISRGQQRENETNTSASPRKSGNGFVCGGETMADARCDGQRAGKTIQGHAAERREGSLDATDGLWWPPEPGVGRVANGIPNRSHRLRALGNAIVPQVAEILIREMARTHNDKLSDSAAKTKETP